MSDTFSSYLQGLELITFFAGYPLLYVVVSVLLGRSSKKNLKSRPFSLLPYSYALIASLYMGLQLKTYYYAGNAGDQFHWPLIVVWGLLANLFWIPFLAKRPGLSLLHSLVFLFPLVKDIFLQVTKQETQMNMVSNDMKLYTISLIIHITAFLTVSFICFLYRSLRVRE